MVCGAACVSFIAQKQIADVPVQSFNAPRVTNRASTVEATIVDLVGYERHAGSLDQVTTILAKIAEQIEPKHLVAAAKTAPVSWAQRLAYLLELVCEGAYVATLKAYVSKTAKDMTPLLLGTSHAKDWRLYANDEVEVKT
jgi:predicted transcriptional regulator of viral defense system